ncbi:glycosyltransferase 28 domain containing 1, putative [Brugia malayi]|uniref:UDP-N-acetylglucosamine transferase subunit ALG13 n=1 Tax=Brugia malayi TaxID=6279 RepID=A0A4E9FNC8_BRUMA|nr:glycosyltransferase 28 domain containing 1, putative [Brugia malayi]VIO97812.1 glycosyltransferase 28 domain containing 1, putative [Brugia malayi]
MSDPHDLTKTWGDIDSAVRRIAARCEVYKDPTDRVFSEATEAGKLVEIKESFEEEALQFRLAVIRQRLKQEKRDSWLRPIGSTEFDALIRVVVERKFLESLKEIGITDLLIQMGKGKIELEKGNHYGININYYRYKDDILQDIAEADLVIGHAGAGTCLEVLRYKKPLVVVVNEELMNNHQWELAERLQELGHIFCTRPNDLAEVIKSPEIFKRRPFAGPDYSNLANIILRHIGIDI